MALTVQILCTCGVSAVVTIAFQVYLIFSQKRKAIKEEKKILKDIKK